jgi:ketosteroid isomerase-like protein
MANVTNEDRIAIEALLTGIERVTDEDRLEELNNYLTEDAVFVMGGRSIEGSDSIIAALSQHGQNRNETTRHVWSNLSIEKVNGDTILTTAVMMVFSVSLAGGGAKSFHGGDVKDVIVRTPKGSRFKERNMIALFPL